MQARKIIITILTLIILLQPVHASVYIPSNYTKDVGMITDRTVIPLRVNASDVMGNITIYDKPDPKVIYAQLNFNLITWREGWEANGNLWLQNVAWIVYENGTLRTRFLNNIWNTTGDVIGIHGKGNGAKDPFDPRIFYLYVSPVGGGGKVSLPVSVVLSYNVSYEKIGVDILTNKTIYNATINFYASIYKDGKQLFFDNYDTVLYYYLSRDENLPPPIFENGGIVLTGLNSGAPVVIYRYVNVSVGLFYRGIDGRYRLFPSVSYSSSGTYERVGNVSVWLGDDFLMRVGPSWVRNSLPAGYRLDGWVGYGGNGSLVVRAVPSSDWVLAILPSNVSVPVYGNLYWYEHDFNDFDYRLWLDELNASRRILEYIVDKSVFVLRFNGSSSYSSSSPSSGSSYSSDSSNSSSSSSNSSSIFFFLAILTTT
ncbi:MAG: thermopsin family protease [Thermoprotei archaeon]